MEVVESTVSNMECEEKEDMSDEEYLIKMARQSLNGDHLESKAWMLTSKTLFPNTFGIQFEGYEIEKMSNNCKEAAEYFSEIFRRFPNNERLWEEILSMMAALRSNNPDTMQKFLQDVFMNITSEVQYELFLITANRSEDTIDQCQLMLLLLRKFPYKMDLHGANVIETLLTSEKVTNERNPLNAYRRLLVCDLLPLLDECKTTSWSSKQLFKLLIVSIEFYLSYIMNIGCHNTQELPGNNTAIEDPWRDLFHVYQIIAKKLNWELSDCFTPYPLNKDAIWDKICKFSHSEKNNSQFFQQLAYCGMMLYIYCLCDYNTLLDPGPNVVRGENENHLVFVEAVSQHKFRHKLPPATDTELKNGKIGCNYEQNGLTYSYAAPTISLKLGLHAKPSKMRKTHCNFGSNTVLTDRGNQISNVIQNFLLASKLYELFHTLDVIEKEFTTLSHLLKLDQLLKGFYVDLALYQGLYRECAKMLGGSEPRLKKSVRMACSNYFLQDYKTMYKDILSVVSLISSFNSEGGVTIPMGNCTGKRSLMFIPLMKLPILQYCCKLMISTLKKCLDNSCVESDLACGHILVLAQLDWPEEEGLVLEIIKKIKLQKHWSYHLFMKYIILIDFLEEFMYLSTEHGGRLTLDILAPSSSQILNHRRMSTRGVDKGAKEDFKMAMRRQTSRSSEPLDVLISKFLSTEKDLISHHHN